jgi:26S proteasome regulatory subunit N10
MLASPTEEAGKVLACFSRVRMGGKSDIITSIQIAQLALKHRKNKNGGARIIVFVGSPLSETTEALQKVGKSLKKNNVAIDVISLGEVEENQEKLQELINAANTSDNRFVF